MTCWIEKIRRKSLFITSLFPFTGHLRFGVLELVEVNPLSTGSVSLLLFFWKSCHTLKSVGFCFVDEHSLTESFFFHFYSF